MEKLTIQNIVEAFASQGVASKKASEALARTFFEVIVEGLNSDGMVKINGLGTFKVISVADRESVNVRNGERIVIEGYKKVTFTPSESALTGSDESVAEKKKPAQKKPSGVKKTKVELKEPEISDADLQQNQFSDIDMIISTPESLKDVRGHLEEARSRAEKTLEEANNALAEKVKYEKMLEEMESVEVKEEKTEAGKPAVQDAGKPAASPVATEDKTPVPEAKKGGAKWVFIILALLVVAVLVWFLARNGGNSQPAQPEPQTEAVPAPVVPAEPADTVPKQKTYIMKRGDFLSRISREVYGTDDSVSAIIRLNKFPNPDNIPVGSTILLP